MISTLEQREKIDNTIEKLGNRGKPGKIKNDVVFVCKSFRKKKVKTYQSEVRYDFLQNIRVIFKWASENNEIGRPMLELLLYLYPIGIFSKSQFVHISRTQTMYSQKTFGFLLEKGFVETWRVANPRKRQHHLYTLTSKARKICYRMHKMCLYEEEIPTSPRVNVLATKEKRIDGYYMDVITEMNKKTRERKEKIKNAEE